MAIVQQIVECVHDAAQTTDKMVLLIGAPGSGKSKILRELASMRGWKYVEGKEILPKEWRPTAHASRQAEAVRTTTKALAALEAEVVLLDNMRNFFAAELDLQPVELLRAISKKQRLLVAWPGEYHEGVISHLRGATGERLEYPLTDITVIQID